MVQDDYDYDKEPDSEDIGVVALGEAAYLPETTMQMNVLGTYAVEQYVPETRYSGNPRHHAVGAQMSKHEDAFIDEPVDEEKPEEQTCLQANPEPPFERSARKQCGAYRQHSDKYCKADKFIRYPKKHMSLPGIHIGPAVYDWVQVAAELSSREFEMLELLDSKHQ